MLIGLRASFCSESRRHKQRVDVSIAKVHGHDHSQTVELFPSWSKSNERSSPMRNSPGDNETLVVLVRNRKSEILNLHGRLVWSCPSQTEGWRLEPCLVVPLARGACGWCKGHGQTWGWTQVAVAVVSLPWPHGLCLPAQGRRLDAAGWANRIGPLHGLILVLCTN